MKWLVDTNTIIYAYRGHAGIRDKLAQTNRDNLFFSAVVLFELEVGCAKSSNSTRLRRFVDDVLQRSTFLDLNAASATEAALARAHLERQGRPIGACDLLIAGTALAHALTVVTRNVGEFTRVPGLRVVNWHDETA
ncbi:MAG: PIN domain-containing protein [Pseudomonadota bacterium]|nr:PIN domain-containing protein [Pseudomonadota bacterium]